jgi:hypothetical protein
MVILPEAVLMFNEGAVPLSLSNSRQAQREACTRIID